jgi:hypothetical protein
MSGFEIRGIQNISFVDLKTGKKINIGNAEVSTLSESKDINEREATGKLDISKTAHFTCELTYLNRKELFQALYGTTNNYRRLHGGHALRETTRRRYIMKHKR